MNQPESDPRSSSSPASTSSSSRRSTRVVENLNAPSRRPTPLGVDTAWALKLKDAINAAVRELHVQVLSAKPICTDATDSGNMRFEMETDRGPVVAVRRRDGTHSFDWK